MLDLIGEEKVNSYLNQWLSDHNFEAICMADNNFWVDLSCNIIHYSIYADEEEIIEIYMEEVSKDFPELAQADVEMLSFFHELGHIETEDEWDEEDWEACENWKENNCASHREYFRYPTEWRATEWACEYILSHKEEVGIFWKKVWELMNELYELNKDNISL